VHRYARIVHLNIQVVHPLLGDLDVVQDVGLGELVQGALDLRELLQISIWEASKEVSPRYFII